LVELAGQAGLDREEVRAMLAGTQYAAEVRAEEDQARKLGVSGVPFFVMGGRYAVSGAQPASVLLGAIEKAWADVHSQSLGDADGAVCSPEGCG
jgi:predicted DsbA family dithiol-disulfide isomerase